MSRDRQLNALMKLVTNRGDHDRLVRRYAREGHFESDGQAAYTLEQNLLSKFKPDDIILRGTLTLEYAQSRPVTIEYEDTGEFDQLVTSPSLAYVGEVWVERKGIKHHVSLYQVWIGRVFPQWRQRTNQISNLTDVTTEDGLRISIVKPR